MLSSMASMTLALQYSLCCYKFIESFIKFVSQQEIEYFKKIIGRGCQVVGTMYIKKVPGNFHMSTHHNGRATDVL